MDTQLPEVSVVIPYYEAPKSLSSALRSIESQTYDNLTCVVVDDGSDVSAKPIIDEFQNVELVEHEENRGAAAARNSGISHSEGEYIAFLDVDDVWTKNKIERQISTFQNTTIDVGLVYSGFRQVLAGGTELEHLPKHRGDIYKKELEKDRVHPTSTVMVKSEALKKVGGFNESLPARQDYELWIRITEKYPVNFVNDILVVKRESAQNISSDFESRMIGNMRVFDIVKRHVGKSEFGILTKARIYSYHYYLIGRDYDLFGRRWKALRYLLKSTLIFPVRLETWMHLIIVLTGIDREGSVLTYVKQFLYS